MMANGNIDMVTLGKLCTLLECQPGRFWNMFRMQKKNKAYFQGSVPAAAGADFFIYSPRSAPEPMETISVASPKWSAF